MEEKKDYICEKCNKNYKNYKSLWKHKYVYHKPDNIQINIDTNAILSDILSFIFYLL